MLLNKLTAIRLINHSVRESSEMTNPFRSPQMYIALRRAGKKKCNKTYLKFFVVKNRKILDLFIKIPEVSVN